MTDFTRRDFLKLGSLLAAAAGLAGPEAKLLAQGLDNIARGRVPVLWIEGQACSGCSVSLLNSQNPGPLEILTQYINLVLHPTVGAAQGGLVLETLEKARAAGGYVLCVEGSIPAGMPSACVIGGMPLTELLKPLLRDAAYVIGVGTCAAFGGIPAAEGNPTGAVSVQTFMTSQGIPAKGRLVNCPSCPTHPQSLVGTLAHLAGGGYPSVDAALLTPDMFYAHSTHDDCPRFHYYSKHIFAEKLGDPEGCLFKLGCLGPLSFTECPRRQWNGGINWCIRASAPCIACSSPHFAQKKDFPFYRLGETQHPVIYTEDDRKGGSA